MTRRKPTVEQAFRWSIKRLHLKPREHQKVEKTHQRMVDRLHYKLDIEGTLVSGSYRRGTAIDPLNHVDLFIELEPTTNALLRRKPMMCLLALYQAIEATTGRHDHIELLQRAVHVQLKGCGVGLDVYPVFRAHNGVEMLNRRADGWQHSNLEQHREQCAQADERSGRSLTPLVKLLKHWRRTRCPQLDSFQLEVMAWNALRSPPRTLAEGLTELFATLGDNINQATPDPDTHGHCLDATLTDFTRHEIRTRLHEATRVAEHALKAEYEGNTELAHLRWAYLLGDNVYRLSS